MNTTIGYSDYHIPDGTTSVEEYVETLRRCGGMSAEQGALLLETLKNTMGFKTIRHEERANEAAIFSELLEAYFADGYTAPDDIDYLVYARGDAIAVGDPWGPLGERCVNVPYYLQNKFGMRAHAFSIEQECSGTLMAIRIVQALMRETPSAKALVLTANFRGGWQNRLMLDSIPVSDGLGIVEVSNGDADLRLVDFAGASDGSLNMVREFGREENLERVVDIGCGLIRRVAERNGLSLDEIALIIPQNLSRLAWHFYCHKLGIPVEKVFLDNCGDIGHMGDVDIIRNITDVRRRDLLRPGDYAVAYSIGTGASWNAALLQMT